MSRKECGVMTGHNVVKLNPKQDKISDQAILKTLIVYVKLNPAGDHIFTSKKKITLWDK